MIWRRLKRRSGRRSSAVSSSLSRTVSVARTDPALPGRQQLVEVVLVGRLVVAVADREIYLCGREPGDLQIEVEVERGQLGKLDLQDFRVPPGVRCNLVVGECIGAQFLRLRSADLLRRILAWRIQAAAEGGLDRSTRQMLAGKAAGPENLLSTGTVITREWKGERHDVEVVEGGFLYRGERWNSLSEVARTITGTRWNGPRFFGLREAA